jgi:hypothetical protein
MGTASPVSCPNHRLKYPRSRHWFPSLAVWSIACPSSLSHCCPFPCPPVKASWKTGEKKMAGPRCRAADTAGGSTLLIRAASSAYFDCSHTQLDRPLTRPRHHVMWCGSRLGKPWTAGIQRQGWAEEGSQAFIEGHMGSTFGRRPHRPRCCCG